MDKILQQFLVIAEMGSISAATGQLHVTQPTLSYNMQKLEETLGVPLFVRTARGMALTDYGLTLLETARRMQRLHANMLKTLEAQRTRTERAISIGSGYSWWTVFLRDLLLDYQRDFPQAPIEVSLGDQLRCLDQLLSGDIALFLAHEIRGLGAGSGTEFIRLSQVYNAIFVRQGHPLLGAPRDAEAIDAYPVVTSLLPETRQQRLLEDGWRDRADGWATRPPHAFASNSLTACLDYVRQTDAILGYSHVIAPYFAQQGLAEVVQLSPPEATAMGIYLLAERRGDARLENLLSRIVEAAARRLPPLDAASAQPPLVRR